MDTPQQPLDIALAHAQRLSGKHLYAGTLQAALSGKTFPVASPATRLQIGTAADGNADDVAAAVGAAAAAQPEWAAMSPRARGKILCQAAAQLTQHTEEIATLLALETGKAIRTESRVEANVLADCFEFYGGLGSELKGETIPFAPNMLVFTQREPIGVVAAILPWNAPLMLMAFKIAPALVAGNTVVVKSAEEAPLSTLFVVELLNRCLPAGVVNILSGFGPSCGGPLVADRRIGKVTFTGSVDTGKVIAHAAAERLIPTTLELGGKSPMIVMEDADLDRTVAGAVAGMRFTRQGQSCTAASRMLVHRSLRDQFVERMAEKVNAMRMGDPLDETTDIGTIISTGQYDRVRSYLDLGRQIPDVQTLQLSAMPEAPALKNGLFIQPTVFVGVDNDNRLAREEIFGPVTCVIPFDTYEQAITMANDSDYGLAATIWTSNLQRALDATRRLQAGFVQVNQNIVAQPGLSYGGIKQSGLGKEASMEAMLDHFTQKKTVLISRD
ncbi:aldehyde dehydrogenase family protein [Castellaniella caeni]|uniref:aldehyde dehydrogenase family protein n=1 Tax=Castellaniella caeni TaxID=266123 RepID=UPI000831DA78|nr:aldehyde dehydrogenase family protein [Castellaniella caeni]